MEMIEVGDFNSRVEQIVARSRGAAKKSIATERLDDMASVLADDLPPLPGPPPDDDDDTDEDLMSQLGLPPPTRDSVLERGAAQAKQRNAHDEGMDELDDILNDL